MRWTDRHGLAHLFVAALLIALFLQAVLSMRLLNASSDEAVHLVAGYTYWQTGGIRLNPEHPPLVKLLAAFPLRFLEPRLNLADPDWLQEPPNQYPFGFHFLYSNDADRLLFWGRLSVVLLAVLLGLYVYRWARDLFGTGAGLLALFLYVVCPNVIAHSRFVTMDLGLSCFFLIALYYLWRFCHDGGGRNLVAAGLGLGLALATKFSAVILVPTMALLLGLAAATVPNAEPVAKGKKGSTPVKLGGGIDDVFARDGLWTRMRRAALAYLLLLLIAFVVIYAIYLFPRNPLVYLQGMVRVYEGRNPAYEYYLLGQFSKSGWPYYFLTVFFLKTPLPTLALLILSVALVRSYRARRLLDEAFLVLPAVIFFSVTSALALPLGVRYILPVYPLLFVFVSRLAGFLLRSRLHLALASVLGGWLIIGALRIYPDHLAYFNELVGGPDNGWKYLDDSNIDWGTDLKRLKTYMEQHGIKKVRLIYTWNGSPRYDGVSFEWATQKDWTEHPSPGIYAVNTHMLIRGEAVARKLGWRSDWLSRYQPIGRVGYGFYLFTFDGAPAPASPS